ncbi:unnamed protein product [Brassica rapa subsp. trilocularis]
MTHSRYGEGVISVQKSGWRPTEVETITSAISSERELVYDELMLITSPKNSQ